MLKVNRWGGTTLLKLFGLYLVWGSVGNMICPLIEVHSRVRSQCLITVTIRTRFMTETIFYIRLGQAVYDWDRPSYKLIDTGRKAWCIDVHSDHILNLVRWFFVDFTKGCYLAEDVDYGGYDQAYSVEYKLGRVLSYGCSESGGHSERHCWVLRWHTWSC